MKAETMDFFKAINQGDHARVRQLTAMDPTLVRSFDPHHFGATPLIAAAGMNSVDMVDLLLELGADIHERSNWWAGGFSVLDGCNDETAAALLQRGATLTPHAAARLGMIDELRKMIDASGAVVHERGGDGQLPLHFSRTTEIAQLLLDRGASIGAVDVDHCSTAAQWLATSRPAVAAFLVSRGAKADPFLAVRAGDVDLIDATIASERDGVEVRVTRERFVAPPPAAGHIYLYTIGEGCGLLHAAAGGDQADVVRHLRVRGADPNIRGGYDSGTPLHTAAWSNASQAAAALVEGGADINMKSGQIHHNEPIGWAIVGGSVDVVRTLLERGATLRQHHLDDAKQGAEGAFRQFNPQRPLAAWQEIAALLAKSTS